jgi:uncharacterized protein YndB with AHSA1/START domain
MLVIILFLTAVCFISFLIVAARQPSDFCITRSGTISAPPADVFAQVNDLQKWETWSPWAKLDPKATNSFTGPSSGIGAAMSWSGNNKVGVGSMTITESKPYELIRFKLEFLKPFKATNTSEFIFKAVDNQTTVTWSMKGTNNFMGKAMGLIMNCDKMVGGQFEQGLAAMKLAAETANAQ